MEIISPQSHFFDCHCKCGAHFLATQKDFKRRQFLIRDPYWTMNSAGSGSENTSIMVIECPFCCGFFAINRYLTDISIENAIMNKDIEGIKYTDDVYPFYYDSDKEKSKYIDVKIIDWKESPYLREKYKKSIELNEL